MIESLTKNDAIKSPEERREHEEAIDLARAEDQLEIQLRRDGTFLCRGTYLNLEGRWRVDGDDVVLEEPGYEDEWSLRFKAQPGVLIVTDKRGSRTLKRVAD